MATYDVFDDTFKVRRLLELIELLQCNLGLTTRAEILSKGFMSAGYAKIVQDIGSVSKNLSPALRQQLPIGLVEELSTLREDILVRYHELDFSRVWEAVNEKVPVLKAALEESNPDPVADKSRTPAR